MVDPLDERARRLDEREAVLAGTRDALRRERAQIAADRVEADRLLAEARAASRETATTRDRAKRLASRFVRFVKHRHASARRQLDADAADLATQRRQFASQVDHLNALRAEFHSAAADARARLHDAWATVESQQRRATTEWTEANRYFTAQTEALDARELDITRREREVMDRLAQAEADTAGLREEAAALDARVQNARVALAEIEQRRESARNELLRSEWPPELFAGPDADDLSQREEQLHHEKTAVAALRATLERESAEMGDRRRVVAEQLGQLADARAQWQVAERQTVIEMEELARSLGQREHELNAREQRLIHADARRRDDSYDLWQLRLRLESWQTKLTAFELRWHTEREQLEANLDRRAVAIAERESTLGATFAEWEHSRAIERDRLREELDLWANDRAKLANAIRAFDQRRQELFAEVTALSGRALAAEQLVSEAVQDSSSDRVTRRFRILRKRWEHVFEQKAKEIDTRRVHAETERAAVDERYRELLRLLAVVTVREGDANNRAAATAMGAVLNRARRSPVPARQDVASAPSAELAALRAEVERLAETVITIELPDPPELSESELPWAIEEVEVPAAVLPFGSGSKAA